MRCNCKVFESVLGVILLIVAMWPYLLGVDISNWIVVIGAILLILHAWRCKNCGALYYKMQEEPVRRRRRRR